MYRIRERRQAQGLTQEALAERCGITQPGLSLIESGRSTRVSTLQAIAKALGCDVRDLFAGTGNIVEDSPPALAEATQ